MEGINVFTIEEHLFNKQYNEAARGIHQFFMGFRKGQFFAVTTEASKIAPELITIYTRLANCLIDLFSDYENYRIDLRIFDLWLVYAREIRAIFTISGFYRTNFLIDQFNTDFKNAINQHCPANNRLADIEQLAFRILLFNMLENEAHTDFAIFFKFFPDATTSSILSLLSSMVVLSPQAANTREKLLGLVPLLENHTLSKAINLVDLSVSWMICSYATRRDKHAIKYYLNRCVHSWLNHHHLIPKLPYKHYQATLKKPTILIALEFFRSWHSMGRSYGLALKNLRDKFHIVGLALQSAETDDSHYTMFDKVITLECSHNNEVLTDPHKMRGQLKKLERLQADIFFYPSLGMHQVAILLANMRLAPIQIISFGHPASSFCDTIDYGIIEADYALDDEDLYSEKMIVLPPESFVSQPLDYFQQLQPTPKQNNKIIFIGVSSALAKISADFLQVCKKITEQSKRRIRFLFCLNDTEIFYLQCKRYILSILPEAQVLHRMPPHLYAQHLNLCDIYLSTFPFGGANSVIDAMCLGLPPVCLRGDEIAARTDSALISRRGLPEWLIASTEDDYIAAALRLIHNDEERFALNKLILERSKELYPENNPNYQQQATNFANACWQIYKKHAQLQRSSKKSFTLEELTHLNE